MARKKRSTSNEQCPFEAVHRRLMDAIALWRAARRSYFQPNLFRRNVNNCIQTARSVTWVLQKQRHRIDGFDEWYAGWQQRMSDDPILRWLRDSRTYIEKQGDLETASTMRVTIIDSYLPNPTLEVDVPANLRTQEIARFLANSDHPSNIVMPNATLRVERRWIDSELPDHELLDAIAHAISVYVEILIDAHASLVVTEYDGRERAELEKLQSSDGPRVAEIALDTKDSIVLSRVRVGRDRKAAQVAKMRYGIDDLGFDPGDSLESFARAIMERAKHVIAIDKWHAIYVWLFRGTDLLKVISTLPNDRREKYLFWREVAEEVRRIRADGLVTVGEAWTSRVERGAEARFPADDPARTEALLVTAEAASGFYLTLMTGFARTESQEITFGRTVEEKEPVRGGFIEPIRAVWDGLGRG
jgi:hypothetical protein